ncbi:MAG: hypothetical protein LLG37_03080 [Spirochaetia bacterium]|nr:hypothetical protein [Spirochaetia bacterium]
MSCYGGIVYIANQVFYVADTGNNRIRKIDAVQATLTPTFTALPTRAPTTNGTYTFTPTVTETTVCSPTVTPL